MVNMEEKAGEIAVDADPRPLDRQHLKLERRQAEWWLVSTWTGEACKVCDARVEPQLGFDEEGSAFIAAAGMQARWASDMLPGSLFFVLGGGKVVAVERDRMAPFASHMRPHERFDVSIPGAGFAQLYSFARMNYLAKLWWSLPSIGVLALQGSVDMIWRWWTHRFDRWRQAAQSAGMDPRHLRRGRRSTVRHCDGEEDEAQPAWECDPGHPPMPARITEEACVATDVLLLVMSRSAGSSEQDIKRCFGVLLDRFLRQWFLQAAPGVLKFSVGSASCELAIRGGSVDVVAFAEQEAIATRGGRQLVQQLLQDGGSDNDGAISGVRVAPFGSFLTALCMKRKCTFMAPIVREVAGVVDSAVLHCIGKAFGRTQADAAGEREAKRLVHKVAESMEATCVKALMTAKKVFSDTQRLAVAADCSRVSRRAVTIVTVGNEHNQSTYAPVQVCRAVRGNRMAIRPR